MEASKAPEGAEKFLGFPGGPRGSRRIKGPEDLWSPDKEPPENLDPKATTKSHNLKGVWSPSTQMISQGQPHLSP